MGGGGLPEPGPRRLPRVVLVVELVMPVNISQVDADVASTP
jgi:hypothetical protein